MAQVDPFARDLGYLAKFLESLRTHASTLDPAEGQRLLSLLDEESGRWAEIKQILAGEATSNPGTTAAAEPASAEPPQAGRPRPFSTGFTVGSLRGEAPGGHSAPR